MVRKLVMDGMGTGGGREGSRRDAASRVWEKLRDKFAVAAVFLVAGCDQAAVQGQQTTPTAPTPAVTQRPDLAARDVEAYVPVTAITVERVRSINDWEGLPPRVRFTATQTVVVPEGGREMPLAEYVSGNGRLDIAYRWFIFQQIPPATEYLLLNPNHHEISNNQDPSQPRYIGAVMRGVTLTDGTGGDFVVRMRGNSSSSESGPEFAPIVESDGRVRPWAVMFQLNVSTLVPMQSALLEERARETAFVTVEARVEVTEWGPTVAAVQVLTPRKMATSVAVQGPSASSLLHPRE